MESRRREILLILAERAGVPAGSIDEATPLFADGLDLDSVAVLEAVVAVEERTGVHLRDEELTDAVLRTVGSFTDHVLARAGGSS